MSVLGYSYCTPSITITSTTTMKDDRKHRKKSDRHRDDERRRRRRDRDEGDDTRTRTSRADESSSSRGKSKLTEEEVRLYEKAQKYLKRKESGGSSRNLDRDESRDRKSHKHSKKDSRKEKKRDHDLSEDDDMRKSKRKKSSKRHRDEDDRDRKKKRQKSNSFRDKAHKVDSKLVSLGDVSGVPPTKLLNPEDDYFACNSHLRLYLYQRHGVYFEDLTSDESHEAFREFVRAYNDGKLEGAYYGKSLPDEALDQCKRTQHQWTFRTNKTEERSLDIVRAGVKKQTDYDGNEADAARARMMQPSGPAFGITRAAPPTAARGPAMPGPEERGPPAPGEVAARRRADRQLRDRVRVGNAEIHGEERAAAGTFERKLQNKREGSSRIHGAARDREDQAYGGAELNDDALYGSGGGRGDASYDAALARERQHRGRREARKAERTDELLRKEEARQKAMFDMLGLSGVKPGEKIKIAPRND